GGDRGAEGGGRRRAPRDGARRRRLLHPRLPPGRAADPPSLQGLRHLAAGRGARRPGRARPAPDAQFPRRALPGRGLGAGRPLGAHRSRAALGRPDRAGSRPRSGAARRTAPAAAARRGLDRAVARDRPPARRGAHGGLLTGRGRMEPLNLARRPFANGRPVVRITGLLWLAGAILLASNVAAYRHYLRESVQKRAELDQVRAERGQTEQRIAALSREFASFDLERQNKQVTYLNLRIAERTFSWSTLLDRLARVLPADVRLKSLRPPPGDRREERLRFVDNLFADRDFAEPNLKSEQRGETGVISFSLSVDYLPEAPGLPL